jgi:hypothetical protein
VMRDGTKAWRETVPIGSSVLGARRRFTPTPEC